MTLEKDKEDYSKYYLSYAKPPVLDMKWANREINVVEWANKQALILKILMKMSAYFKHATSYWVP